MTIHLYWGIENLGLTTNQRDTLIEALRQLGDNANPSPARRNHWSTRNDMVIFEALFDEDHLSIPAMKNRLGTIFNIDPGSITHTNATPAFGIHHSLVTTFYNSVDRLRVTVFGYDATWPTREQSRQEVKAYLRRGSVVWAGSSITAAQATWSFRNRMGAHLSTTYPYSNYQFNVLAIGGHNTWSNLIRLSRNGLAYHPTLLIFDCTNDARFDWNAATVEAFIRRVWAHDPTTHLLAWNFIHVADYTVDDNVNTPTNVIAIGKLESILEAYGIPLLDDWRTIQDLVVSQGHHLNEYLDASNVHPTELGHDVAYNLLLPHMPYGGAVKPDSYPARLYDTDGLFETNEPTILLGTNYVSRTGTWTDTGTRIESSEAGATVTYQAVCQTYGGYRADGVLNPTVQVSIDGGAFGNVSVFHAGTLIAAGLGSHTITVKIVSGTFRLDEFWAV